MTPEGSVVETLSLTAPPTTIRPFATTGGDVE
jgi:hypothetical protein